MRVILMFLGGSGAKCAEAFLHAGILTGGFGSNVERISVQILDPDTNTPTQKKLAGLPNSYTQLRNQWSTQSGFFSTELQHWPNLSPHSAVAASSDSKLATLLGCDTPVDEDVLRFFLSETQYEKDLRHGLYGWPNLGAAVWNQWLTNSGLPAEKEIKEALNQNSAVRVVLIGSIFGGTGASGIPTLGKRYKEKFGHELGFEIHGLVLTPYFAPPPKDGNETIKAEQNPLRAKHVLRLLDPEHSGFQSIHFLGLPNPVSIPKYEEDQQNNPTSTVERVAAWTLWTKHCNSVELQPGCHVLGVENPDGFSLAQFQGGAAFEGAVYQTALTFAFLAFEYGHHWKQKPDPQSQKSLEDSLGHYGRSLTAWLEGPFSSVLKKGEGLGQLQQWFALAGEATSEWLTSFRNLEGNGEGPWDVFVKAHKAKAFHEDVKIAFHQIRSAITT